MTIDEGICCLEIIAETDCAIKDSAKGRDSPFYYSKSKSYCERALLQISLTFLVCANVYHPCNHSMHDFAFLMSYYAY